MRNKLQPMVIKARLEAQPGPSAQAKMSWVITPTARASKRLLITNAA